MSNRVVTRLLREFEKFDRENPAVWQLFIRYANDLASAGHHVLSVSMVIERIRWETTVVTRSDSGFKICNNHRAYYARKWNQLFTTMPKFRLRRARGEYDTAHDCTNLI